MKKTEALEQLVQLLNQFYDDRDDLAALATGSNLSISAIGAGVTVSDFLRNIVVAAHREGKVEALIRSAAFDHSEQAVAIKQAFILYQSGEADDPRAGLQPGLQNELQDAPAPPSLWMLSMEDANAAAEDKPSGGDDIEVGNINGTGIAVGRGAKAIVNNLYQTVNQTVQHLSSRALWGSAVGVFLIAVILFWTFWGKQVTAYFTPLWLDKGFNIAVIEFGEIQSPSGKMAISTEGSEISQWLYNGLWGSYEQFDAEVKDQVGIVHSSSPEVEGQGRRFAPLLMADAVAQCNAAKARAGDMNAQMLIFGNLDKRTEPAQFELSFYISPDVQTWLATNNLITGTRENVADCLPLGDVLPVLLPFSNAISRDKVLQDVSAQGTLFFWLTLGLIQDQQGNSHAALKYFSAIEAHLSGLSKHEAKRYGADLVSYFVGQQYLLKFADEMDRSTVEVATLDLTLLDSAVENFQKGADLEGNHQNRAEKGLGDVWYWMSTIAQKQFADSQSEDVEVLEISARYTTAADIIAHLLKHRQNMAQALGHATSHYAKAAELTRYLDDPYLTLVIEFAAAETTWAEGQLLYISHAYDEAMVKMNSAIERFTVGEDSLLNRAIGRGDDRLVTKAYQTLGVAYFQLSDMLRIQGQPAERMAHLRKAEELFQQCVAKKDDAFLDKLIKDEMVADFCQPQLEETQRALADLLAQEGGE